MDRASAERMTIGALEVNRLIHRVLDAIEQPGATSERRLDAWSAIATAIDAARAVHIRTAPDDGLEALEGEIVRRLDAALHLTSHQRVAVRAA